MARLTDKNALICGDSRNLITTFPFDVDTYGIFFTVRSKTTLDSNDDTNAKIAKTKLNGITVAADKRTVTIALTPTDTRITPGSYEFDIQAVSPANFVTSTRRQPIDFIEDVSKST